MDYQTLIILAAFLALGLLTLVLLEWRERKRAKSPNSPPNVGGVPTGGRGITPNSASPDSVTPNASSPLIRVPVDDQCCGRHLVCERESLLTTKPEIIYYDDEELDRLANLNPDNYTEQDLSDLNEVFTTLRPAEVAGWLRSLQLRQIELPQALKEEALMIVAERRFSPAK